MRDDVEVRDEGRLEDDGDVGGVKELDGVGRILATVAHRFDREVHSESWNKRVKFRTCRVRAI